MAVQVKDQREPETWTAGMAGVAWVLILIVDVGYVAWGSGAAAAPDRLLGPGGKAILPARYDGYSGGSWRELAGAAPLIMEYLTLLYGMYGVYSVLFGRLGSTIVVTASAAVSAGHGGLCLSATPSHWCRRSPTTGRRTPSGRSS